MSKREDVLLEIFTAELPPKSLFTLGSALLAEVEKGLKKARLAYTAAQFYATPRRLAVWVKGVDVRQAAQVNERKGPALAAAFDAEGKPTPACLGFARSCGVEVKALVQIINPQGAWVGYTEKLAGQNAVQLLPGIVQAACNALPIAKRMRWGENTESFVRPVHSAILLFGKKVVKTTLLNCITDRITYGHRFHYPKPLKIAEPKLYAKTLEAKGFVIADFMKRQALIEKELAKVVKKVGKDAKLLVSPALLAEVTGLVEWPVGFIGSFDEAFLEVPAPALISAMQDHQRYFPITTAKGQLLAHFAAIANIQSKTPAKVVAGNERVLRARLSDAAFFYNLDKKTALKDRIESLKGIVFQAKLGTLYEKTQRLMQLGAYLAKAESASAEKISATKRAALLAKADLTSGMVGEFPELQGTMGFYYAQADGEDQEVAEAIVGHYHPRFSGDSLPKTDLGCYLALADRIDTLIGIFGINQIPTGDKDPYGLRRAAIGIIRILIEKKMMVDLRPLLEYALSLYGNLENKEAVNQLLKFLQERLKSWYNEQGITPDIFAAVAALNLTQPYDLHRRIEAVKAFKKLPDAQSLSMANKRVSNILAQNKLDVSITEIQSALFEDEAEKLLVKALVAQKAQLETLKTTANYVDTLKLLANLRQPIDLFFDKVMVMTEDKAKRQNRLLILTELRALFLLVADIALLADQN